VSEELKALIKKTKSFQMTEQHLDAQRVSFAYGNTHFENGSITKETVIRESRNLKASREKNGRSAR